MSDNAQAMYCLLQFTPGAISYPTIMPGMPLGSNLWACSLVLSPLGLKYTNAPKGIFSPLNSLPWSLHHALTSSSPGSTFRRWHTHRMANFQKHAGSPASSRHVVVVAMTNWLLRSAKEFVDGLPGNAWSKGMFRACIPLTNCLALSE